MKQTLRIHKFPNAYVTLLSVLIIGAITITTSVSLLLLGLGFSRSSFALEQSSYAKALAHTCIEEALQKIRERSSVEETSGLTFTSGTCIYTITRLTGQNRLITSSGVVNTVIRKIRVRLDKITPLINISSYEEVSDF